MKHSGWNHVPASATADNNNKDFLSVNILEDQAQWRAKIKGLSNHIIVNNAQMDG